MSTTAKRQKIPKKIHFIFLAKDETMPEVFDYCVNRAKELHPGWEINFYNEDDAQRIIRNHFPELKDLYNSFPLNVQRADILRLLVVYLYGGFYLDLDIYCLKNLEPLLNFHVVLGEEKHLRREVCTAFGLKNPKRIANYMFGSIPKHRFWLGFLNEIMNKSLVEIKDENDILESTGALLLTNFYHTNANAHKDIVLLLNKDRFCLNDNHREIACHFGNYAAHLHTGTWRWQNGQVPKFNDIATEKKIPVPFENLFRYKIQSVLDYSNFFFKETISETESIYNKELLNAFKKMGNVITNLREVNGEKVVLYGPIYAYKNEILPRNTYTYCNGSFNEAFTPEEVNFINDNFKCCIVPTNWLKERYKRSGIVTDIQIIEPGFRRYKRDHKGDRSITQFKLGCFAATLDSEMLVNLIEACKNLAAKQIPSIKIKLYDPGQKFKALYTELETSGIVEYVGVIVIEDFFSDWFSDLAAAFFGYSEPWRGNVLEFLYMGIPVIFPNTENQAKVLANIAANPAVIMQLPDSKDQITTVANIEKAIHGLYVDFDYYSSNALDASEEIEDIQTIEETEQQILDIITEI